MGSTEKRNDDYLTLPPSVILQFEKLCNDVEDKLRQGSQIDLPLVLQAVPLEHRVALFRELIELHKSYIASGHYVILAESLQQAFPDYRQIIDEIFGKQDKAITIDKYQLIHRIGTGGMGEVWHAVQLEPVRRNVAIKLIKSGMDSRLFLQRFAQERQLLALMDHPNIAHIYDGGVTDKQQPYMVMELIDGLPLTRFCDEHKLTIQHRLELFLSVCHAVQHAHQKGIIHRDLKPANILVMQVDGVCVPKIIDFGVAKAVRENLTSESLTTQRGSLVGTLEYMSPEQTGWTSDDIDTRSDIYSLGVILYELIAGLRPFDFESMQPLALEEMVRTIKEEEPPSLFSRLSTCQSLSDIATLRKTDPSRLMSSVKGELEWIVHKCLEKDRSQRYETVSSLARDIERYLNDEPVEARPITASYRFRKFIRRHRVPVMAAGLILLSLIGGIIGTSLGMYQANEARIAEQKAKEEAQEHLAFSRKTNAIIGSIFKNLDYSRDFQTVSELMEALKGNLIQAVSSIASMASRDELEMAHMQNILAVSLANIGEYKQALELSQKSFDVCKAHYEPDHPQLLEVMHNLGKCYEVAGKIDQAAPLLEEVFSRRKVSLGSDNLDTLEIMSSVAGNYSRRNQYDRALPLELEVLSKRKAKLGDDHPDTLLSMQNLASLYWKMHHLDKSIPLFEELLPKLNAKFGEGNSLALLVKNNLAVNYISAARPASAVPLLQDVLKRRQAKLNFDHPSILVTMHDLAGAHLSMNRIDLAVPIFEEVLRIREKTLGRKHPETLRVITHLGVTYRKIGQFKKAVALLEESYQSIPRDLPRSAEVGNHLLYTYYRAGMHAQAAKLFDSLVADYRKKPPQLVADQVMQLTMFGQVMLDYHKYAEAEPFLRECLALCEKTQPDHWKTFHAESLLGGALLGQKKYSESEKHLVNGVKGLKQREKTLSYDTFALLLEAYDRVIQYCKETNKPGEMIKWQLEKKLVKMLEQKK